MKKFYLALCITIIGLQANAQIVSWDFNGNTGSEAFVAPTAADPNLGVSQINRGIVISTALANSYAATNWTLTNSLADAIFKNSYYGFTLKANAGFILSVSELNANFRRSATGPTRFQWMYSLDGSNFSVAGAQIIYNGTQNNGAAQSPVDVSSIPQLQDIPDAITVTLRLYGFGALDAAGSFASGRLNGNDLSILGKVYPSILLPVKLISFNAVNNTNNTRLHWLVNCTSSSVNFELQRAGKDRNFFTIYNKSETQARCTQPFTVNDDNTAPGINFYRLKMIDIDGHVAYSHIVQVENKKTINSAVRVYPTVVDNNATIVIPVEENYTAEILFIDNQGKQVEKMTVQLFAGTNNVSVNVNHFTPGKYYIKVVTGDKKNNTAVLIKR